MYPNMKQNISRKRIAETCTGLLILCALCVIGAGVYFAQFNFNPNVVDEPEATPVELSESLPAGAEHSSFLAGLLPGGLAVMGAVETFDPDTLSDKIDGRADLYLTSGFVNLQAQRFIETDDAGSWIEVYAYDMGGMRNAFSVYTAQRRDEAEEAGLTRFSYKSENALFLVHGRYYVEMIASAPSERVMGLMTAFGSNFAARVPAQEEPMPEVELFPAEQLVEGSVALQLADTFGFDRFTHIFLATYACSTDTEVMAFLSMRDSENEASGLVGAYQEFLLANGGTNELTAPEIPGALVVNLYDTYEVVFSYKNVIAGIHATENREAAEQVARRMYERLRAK